MSNILASKMKLVKTKLEWSWPWRVSSIMAPLLGSNSIIVEIEANRRIQWHSIRIGGPVSMMTAWWTARSSGWRSFTVGNFRSFQASVLRSRLSAGRSALHSWDRLWEVLLVAGCLEYRQRWPLPRSWVCGLPPGRGQAKALANSWVNQLLMAPASADRRKSTSQFDRAPSLRTCTTTATRSQRWTSTTKAQRTSAHTFSSTSRSCESLETEF